MLIHFFVHPLILHFIFSSTCREDANCYHSNTEVIYSENRSVSLEIESNSVEKDVHLCISTITAPNVPSIPCDFGETIISDIFHIEPTQTALRIPAVLSINHSIAEIPELSELNIKYYDYQLKEWLTLHSDSGTSLIIANTIMQYFQFSFT